MKHAPSTLGGTSGVASRADATIYQKYRVVPRRHSPNLQSGVLFLANGEVEKRKLFFLFPCSAKKEQRPQR